MASAWLRPRLTASGGKRWRVEYRLGGRESSIRYGGSFQTQREALLRKAYIAGELAARRVPDLSPFAEPSPALTFAEAAKRWQASRVDVAEATTVQHRSAINRALPHIGTRCVDELTVQDVAELVGVLHAAGKKRESIRKSRT